MPDLDSGRLGPGCDDPGHAGLELPHAPLAGSVRIGAERGRREVLAGELGLGVITFEEDAGDVDELGDRVGVRVRLGDGRVQGATHMLIEQGLDGGDDLSLASPPQPPPVDPTPVQESDGDHGRRGHDSAVEG